MSLSANLKKIVTSVMAKTGTDATLICPSVGVYDYDTNSVVSTPVTYPVRVIVMDFALISNGALADKNTLIASSDKQVYMDMTQSDGTQPHITLESTGYSLQVGSTTYRITVVKQYNPSTSSCIMYDLKVEL